MKVRRTLTAIATCAMSALALAETPIEGVPPQPQGSSTTRAEVQAELELARQAGLLHLQSAEAYDPASEEARQAQARYEELRNGPAYQAARQRHLASNS